MAVAVAVEDFLCEGAGDEVPVAVDAVHLFLSLVEFVDQLVGGE